MVMPRTFAIPIVISIPPVKSAYSSRVYNNIIMSTYPPLYVSVSDIMALTPIRSLSAMTSFLKYPQRILSTPLPTVSASKECGEYSVSDRSANLPMGPWINWGKNVTKRAYLNRLCSASILSLYTSIRYPTDWNAFAWCFFYQFFD